MYKVIDVFECGNMLSVTVSGNGEGISNGTKLVDNNGQIITVQSVAMTKNLKPEDINLFTTLLVTNCNIQKGSVLSIA